MLKLQPVCEYYVFTLRASLSSDRPDAPVSVRLIGISEDSVTIEWGGVASDGGAPVSGFVIEKREPRSHYWSQVATVPPKVNSYVIQYLHRNSSYYVRVAAQNEEGTGTFRDLMEPVTPMRPKSECRTVDNKCHLINSSCITHAHIQSTRLHIRIHIYTHTSKAWD